jgi:hypothetical protein
VRRRIGILLGGAMMAAVALGAAAGAPLNALLSDFQLIPLGRQKPPTVALPTIDGQTVALRDLTGRVVLLYFWATW